VVIGIVISAVAWPFMAMDIGAGPATFNVALVLGVLYLMGVR
jgi:hypothetical protein